mmetsp:Transcript_28475/g.47827  ORF Transcript_28475/g.47827 Transcript_28475/m.47827 type:complete len:286 (-) Transcript_28475:237-1094(-)|eukprot:CAMPEP_0198211526 /NCGR_PEP_ID=MMETSP1445-20131203/24288_1 /TAXON_ID=36898 /ORGANISM="Pyramimonas sp., Strain CCMP2087" /LENGTH=285 /DNA_ID=CAMNT_0043885799 /DNA_START=235 /DNA_END=1092 /DNA_ORIENTATION=+
MVRYQLFLCLLSPIEELFPDLGMSWWTPPDLRLERYVRLWPGRVMSILTVWTPILSVVAQLMDGAVGQLFTALLTAAIFGAFAVRLRLLGGKLDAGIFKTPAWISLTEKNKTHKVTSVRGDGVHRITKVDEKDPQKEAEGSSTDVSKAGSPNDGSLIYFTGGLITYFTPGLPEGSLEVARLLKETDGYRIGLSGGLSFEALEVAEMLYFIVFSSLSVIVYLALDDSEDEDAAWLGFAAVGAIFVGANFMAKFRHRSQPLDILGRVVFTIGFLTNLYNLNRADSRW